MYGSATYWSPSVAVYPVTVLIFLPMSVPIDLCPTHSCAVINPIYSKPVWQLLSQSADHASNSFVSKSSRTLHRTGNIIGGWGEGWFSKRLQRTGGMVGGGVGEEMRGWFSRKLSEDRIYYGGEGVDGFKKIFWGEGWWWSLKRGIFRGSRWTTFQILPLESNWESP